MDDTQTISMHFGGREYTGRPLSADQILAIRSIPTNDTALMLDVMEDLARYAFGEDGFREHLRARARGSQTVAGFIKLMVKFMEASLEHIQAQKEEDTYASPDVPDTFKASV